MAGAGSRLPTIVQVVLPLAVMGWLLAQWMIWLSVFGTYTTLFVLLIMLLFVTLPFSVGLMSLVIPDEYEWGMAIGVVLQVGVFLGSSYKQWRALQHSVTQGSQVLDGVLCRVHLFSGRIESARPTDQGLKSAGKQTGLWGGAASVIAYPLVSHWLGNAGILTVGACLGHALALWLHVVVGARWLAMSCLLLKLEQRAGQRFVPCQLEWLEAQRQAHWWGRVLRRVWPCPVPLKTKGS
jgi:hypothetical protein